MIVGRRDSPHTLHEAAEGGKSGAEAEMQGLLQLSTSLIDADEGSFKSTQAVFFKEQPQKACKLFFAYIMDE